MKRLMTASAALALCTLFVGTAVAEQLRQPKSIGTVSYTESYYQPEVESSPSDRPIVEVPSSVKSAAQVGGGAACDAGCSCNDCCRSGCFLSDLLPCCELGEPCELFGTHCGTGIKIGGWTQIGYHNYNTGQFNNDPYDVNLHQQYIYAERVADGSVGMDWGFRIDYVYGVDGPDTQAFGGPPTSWDNTWDNGGFYGHAIPQLYAEVAYGDLSIKGGHFYTIIGYEVVTAPDNFFYSHAFTMFNAEPFTHTGVLATYGLSENVEVYGGWVQGWDTGFSSSGGDAFLGGLGLTLTDNASLTYAVNAGTRTRADEGYGHSVVLDWAWTDRLQYVFQTDYNSYTTLKTFGINQYLFYQINDCWSAGTRFEWWRTRVAAGDNADLFEYTFGMNYRPNANVVLRPEIRYDRDNDGVIIPAAHNNRLGFGMDLIVTF